MEFFKAYLTIEGSDKQEIRKFSIDSDVATSFLYLKEKLQCVFPIRGKQFTITWKDAEGDHITISSDSELSIALQESPANINHKLYIVLHPDNEKECYVQPEQVANMRHRNIICDGCDTNLQGFRYKCMECPDYDLCSKCETRGLHPEHCMLRLAIPVQWTSRHGKRLAHHMKKFIRTNSGHVSREEHPRKECSKKEHTRECPVMKEVHFDSSKSNMRSASWANAFGDYLDDLVSCPMAATCSKPPEPATEATATSSESQSQETKKEAKPHIDILKIVEDNIAQLLNPFGIDISMKIKDNEKSNAKPNDTPTKQTDSTEPSTANLDPSAKFPGKGGKLPEQENQNNLGSNIESSNNMDSSSEKSVKSDDDDWTLLNKEEKSSVAAAAHAAVQTSPDLTTSAEHTNMEHKMGNIPSAPGQEQSNQSIYPPLPNAPPIKPTVYHLDPKIQSALEFIMAMGFNNEDGMITQLLVTENGDIGKVLNHLL